MMFDGPRVLAMLRRIAEAIEDQNRIAMELMNRQYPEKRQTRPFTISQTTVEEPNEKHKRESEGRW